MRIADYLARGVVWGITGEALDAIRAIADRENDLEAVLKERGTPLENAFKVEQRGNVAIMSVEGPIFPKANLFTQISGAASVDVMASNMGRMEGDSSIDYVVMDFNSPGGAVKGINEFAGIIKNFGKPVIAYVSGTAASAAYWLASAADEIVIDKTAALGSIGIRATFRKAGSEDIEILSSNAPDKTPDVGTDEGRALVQTMIDDTEAVFIETVTANRNLTREQVTQLRGGIAIGAKAISAGLADRFGSLEGIIQELTIRGQSMDMATLKADHKELYQAVFKEGAASVNAGQAKADGASAERERIAAILNHDEAKGREAQAKALALDTELTPEAAAKVLAASPKEAAAGDQFSRHMAKLGNPEVGPDDEDDGADTQASAQAGWTKAAAKVVSLNRGKR